MKGCGKKLDIPYDSDEPYNGCGSFKCGEGILCKDCSQILKSTDNHSQQHGEKPTYSGEVDCTGSLDSDRKINSGFDSSGTESKNPPADVSLNLKITEQKK